MFIVPIFLVHLLSTRLACYRRLPYIAVTPVDLSVVQGSMNKPSANLRLDHLYLTARKPDWLAEWYAERFGFVAKGGFVITGGMVLVFKEGEPEQQQAGARFGFRAETLQDLRELAAALDAELVETDEYASFSSHDPEGYEFEVYFEGSELK